MTWRWPVRVSTVLPDGQVLTLRPLGRGDRTQWEGLRSRNEEWLRPWEATAPGEQVTSTPFRRLRHGFDRAGRMGAVLPLVIDVGDRIVGSVQLFDIIWGSRRSALAGYWLGREATGRGLATWSLALIIDHALLEVGLHRVEVGIRPDNPRSIAVARRLGLPEEGLRRDFMHVDGQWRDHRVFVALAEDLGPDGWAPGGLVRQLRGPIT
ncbi:GNAT family N-acetyltransferase [Ornithinimicrobium panacihumi]|uniref:GNAT family N-acetyltransferase n=1 Tax=Ornithinimicrobium panacihumi TaxID=2008449 RepID=UPI003F889FDC